MAKIASERHFRNVQIKVFKYPNALKSVNERILSAVLQSFLFLFLNFHAN